MFTLKSLLLIEVAGITGATLFAFSDTVEVAALNSLAIMVAAVAGVVNTWMIHRTRQEVRKDLHDVKRGTGVGRRKTDQKVEGA